MNERFEDWLKGRDSDADPDDGVLLPGTVVGDYRIEAFLGKGGFAEVYSAKSSGGADVAIKILHRLDEKSRLRFERESRILAQARHRNLPVFYGFGACGERPYIVMELLCANELPRRGRDIARFLTAIMSAVEEIHRCGFVHRDIKPSNILHRADGEPVLVDFGLSSPISEARRQQESLSVDGENRVAVGTLGFSAPEQFAGLVSGPSSDIHALGALIGACFGDRMPRCWRKIYLTATNSNPQVRYQTVASMRRAVALRHSGKWLCAFFGVVALALLALAVCEVVRGRQTADRVQLLPDGCRYASPNPVIVALPVSSENGDAMTNVLLSCQILYGDSSPRQGGGDARLPMRDAGKLLNDWLKEFLRSEYDGMDFDSVCEAFKSPNFASDLQFRFETYVDDRIEEMPEERRIRIDYVDPIVQAEGAFKDELDRRRREEGD